MVRHRVPWSHSTYHRFASTSGCRLPLLECSGTGGAVPRPNTIKAAGTIFLTTGHVLYSDIACPIFTIAEDQFGGHDTIGGCCSGPSNRMLYGVEDCSGCRGNFLHALVRHGLGRDVVPNVNFFMRVPVDTTGSAAIAHGVSPPGCEVALRAEVDALTVISNCPQVNNPCNGYNPTPIRVRVT